MNAPQTIFLSYLLGAPVLDADGKRIGTFKDLVVQQSAEALPEVVALILKGAKGRVCIAMEMVASIKQNELRMRLAESALVCSPIPEDQIFLRRDLLDAQVVDMDGAKVVRVNDILLGHAAERTLVTGLDIGPWGLMRRLGVAAVFASVVQATRLKVPEGVITWDAMEPIAKDPSRIHLKVSQERLVRMHPADLAGVVEEIGHDQRTKLYGELSNEQLADLIEESTPAMQSSILSELEPERAADVLEEMEPDEAADLLGELSDEEARNLIQLMEPEDAASVQQLLAYEEETAGAMMTTSFLALDEDATVQEAIAWFKEARSDVEIIAYFYLLNSEHRLTSVVSIRRILLANGPEALKTLAAQNLYFVREDTPQREVADLVDRYSLTAVPVVNSEHEIVGVISANDVMEYLREHRS